MGQVTIYLEEEIEEKMSAAYWRKSRLPSVTD